MVLDYCAVQHTRHLEKLKEENINVDPSLAQILNELFTLTVTVQGLKQANESLSKQNKALTDQNEALAKQLASAATTPAPDPA